MNKSTLSLICGILFLFNMVASVSDETSGDNLKTINQDSTVNIPSADRPEPPFVASIVLDDITYYLASFKDESLSSSTTYLIAEDKDGEQMWGAPIYEIIFDKVLEIDVQEVFPSILVYDRALHVMIIENEIGATYHFDLSTFEVKKTNK